jgi:hypothetical protein
MRQGPWRSIAFAIALLIATIWAVGAGWYVSDAWPVRSAMARIELSREEIACGNRSASAANQQRCRDLAEIMSRADQAQAYFFDGLIVFGPALLIFGLAYWLRPRRPPGRPKNQHPHHHHRPSAA